MNENLGTLCLQKTKVLLRALESECFHPGGKQWTSVL